MSRGQEKAIWERFRVACDRFFTRRQADLVERKAVWAANLAKKEALCAQVEALADSTDWDATAAEIKRLQAEWKTIGPVKKSRSDAIWQRFRGACDRFFARYAQRHDIARAERVAAREAICAELEALAPAARGLTDRTVSERLERRQPRSCARSARRCGRFAVDGSMSSAARGVDREQAAALDERFARGVRARRRGLACGVRRHAISIPTPIASGWRRWYAGSRISPGALGAASGRCRRRLRCRRRPGLRRC